MAVLGSNLRKDAARERNADQMLAQIAHLRDLEKRAVDKSARAAATFERRGKLLPRARLGELLDPGRPFLELMTMAGYCGIEDPDPETSIPGAAIIAGIGEIAGTRCMVVVNDAGINAGAMQGFTATKVIRCQEIALEQKLPFIQLVESAGGNLRKYQVERFVNGGGMFYNLARLSAAGLPVVSLVHGSSAAGGAYLPGLSDYVVMVRNQAHAYLAGPSLLKSATGEIASDEELGGAEMHASISGLADYVARNDQDGIAQVRDIVRAFAWQDAAPAPEAAAPLHEAEDLLALMPVEAREPVEMRELIARLVDGSDFHEFKEAYGPHTICGYGAIGGFPAGFLTNNGPLDPAGAAKAAEFIQLCTQLSRPLVFLQNITGFIVGRAYEEAGIIKHGAKLIQALSNAPVPKFTVMCGASFGAGNYGMCGRAFHPDLLFSWPNSKTAVMGGQQAAMTMRMVSERAAERRGTAPDTEALDRESEAIVAHFEAQSGAVYTSSRLLDDGIIDPRDTREVLRLALACAATAKTRRTTPIQFGVARF